MEGILPVVLLVVGLVEVDTTTRGDSINHGLEDVGGIVLASLHGSGSGSRIPVTRSQADRQTSSPSGVNSVVGVSLVRDVESLAGERSITLGHGGIAKGVHDDGVLLRVEEKISRHDAATGEGSVVGGTLRQRSKVEGDVIVVASRNTRSVLVLNAAAGEIIKEWLHQSVDTVKILAGHGESQSEELVRSKDVSGTVTVVDEAGEKSVESTDSLPENVIANLAVVEDERSTANNTVLVNSAGHGQNNTKSATTTTANSPVQIRVLGRSGNQVATISSDDLPLENVISSKTKSRHKHRVTTTLAVTTRDTDCRARSTNDLVSGVVSSKVSLETLDTSAKLQSRAVVVGRAVLGDVLGGLEVVSPEGQTALAGALSKVAEDILVSLILIEVYSGC